MTIDERIATSRVGAGSGLSRICYSKIMDHSITLSLPEKAWQDLLRASRDRREAPEVVAEKVLRDAVSDPLKSLFGCLEYSSPDISERHDEYIGTGIRAEQGRD